MKKNHLRCLHCKKAFESRRNDAKFCSNACRTNAYLERHNKEKPAFLSKQKPPEKSDNISGVENAQNAKIEYRQFSNPEWVRLENQMNGWKKKHAELLQERAKAMEKYNFAVKKNNRLATTILGAGLGVGIASIGEEKPKTEDLVFAALGGGFFGFIFGQEETDAEFQKKLAVIGSQVNEIDRLIMYAESMIQLHITALRKTRKYDVKPILIPPTEQTDVELPTDKKPPEKASKAGIMNSAQIAEMKFDTWNFTGIWGDFLGSPDKGFATLIFGKAGAGKSTFALRLAHYFAEHHGKVLFIASEERVGESLKHKINAYNLQSQNLFIGVPDERSFEGAKKLIEENKSPFIFIDSVNHLQISVKQVEELRKKYPKITFVMIFQATKDGQIKGPAEYEHNADIVLKVEDQQAHIIKNRFIKKQNSDLSSKESPNISQTPVW